MAHRHGRKRGSVAAVTFALALAAGCGDSTASLAPAPSATDDGTQYVPGAAWRVANPESVGFDAARLEALLRDVSARRFGGVDGLLVVRRGYLVAERYVGWSPQAPHTMQSVTKSVTSLLYGIATRAGDRPALALDAPVIDAFPRYAPVAHLDGRKLALTFRHLLTMRTAMDFWEQPYPGSPLETLNRSTGDWTRYILDRPMTGVPGSDWAYNSGAAIAICSALREALGEHADSFARRELFGPIGVTDEAWARSPHDGLPHCGGGLSLKPADLARVGYLVLRRGRWGDRQVVPAEWIELSTRPVVEGPPLFFASYGPGYGYLWWTFPTRRGASDHGVVAASGSGGQWLFVVDALDLVVVVVAADGDGLRLFYDGVLPALTS